MGTEMFQQNSTSELEASGSFLKTWSSKDESLKQVSHSYIPPWCPRMPFTNVAGS